MNRDAFLAWVVYYAATEAFDRTLSGGWSQVEPDSWQPDPGRPLQASQRHARVQLGQMPEEFRRDRDAAHAANRFTEKHHGRELHAEAVIALAREAFPAVETLRVQNMHDRTGNPGAVAQIARMIADVGGTSHMEGTTMVVTAAPDAMKKIRRGFVAIGAVLSEASDA